MYKEQITPFSLKNSFFWSRVSLLKILHRRLLVKFPTMTHGFKNNFFKGINSQIYYTSKVNLVTFHYFLCLYCRVIAINVNAAPNYVCNDNPVTTDDLILIPQQNSIKRHNESIYPFVYKYSYYWSNASLSKIFVAAGVSRINPSPNFIMEWNYKTT